MQREFFEKMKGEYAKRRSYFKKYMNKYMREVYVPKHREEINLRSKKYKLNNSEKYLAYQKKWRGRNSDYFRKRKENFKKDGRCYNCGKVKTDISLINCIQCRGKFLK